MHAFASGPSPERSKLPPPPSTQRCSSGDGRLPGTFSWPRVVQRGRIATANERIERNKTIEFSSFFFLRQVFMCPCALRGLFAQSLPSKGVSKERPIDGERRRRGRTRQLSSLRPRLRIVTFAFCPTRLVCRPTRSPSSSASTKVRRRPSRAPTVGRTTPSPPRIRRTSTTKAIPSRSSGRTSP